jgi:hypothetical protein
MSITRRSFISKTSLAGLSGIATLGLANLTFAQSAGAKKSSGLGTFPVPNETTLLDKLTREKFAAVIGSNFAVTHPTLGRFDVFLKDVEDLTPQVFKSKVRAGIECFNLVFACQSKVSFRQETVTLEHEKLGRFDLFIVQGKEMRYGYDYGAIINRLAP